MNHLTTHRAAQELGISRHTLEAWRIKGIGPRFRKIGRRVLYEQGDLVVWASNQSRTSTSDSGSAAAV